MSAEGRREAAIQARYELGLNLAGRLDAQLRRRVIEPARPIDVQPGVRHGQLAIDFETVARLVDWLESEIG